MCNNRKFDCENCGSQDYALIDGYFFGERILEGVNFEVRVSMEGSFSVKVDPQSEPYFEKLNKKKWLKEAKAYVEQNDVFTCPVCGDDCCLETQATSTVIPRKIKTSAGPHLKYKPKSD